MIEEKSPNQLLPPSSKSTFGVLLLYILTVILITWPVVSHLTSQYAGGRDDQLVHRWTFWWIKEALATRQNPFYTTMLYFPDGVPLLSHNIAWLNIAFWLPLQAVIGDIAAYNVMFLTIYTLNGFATFLFARDLIRKTVPAFVAGLVVCLWPYTLSHFDHPNMILLFPLPLVLLFWGRMIKRGGWSDTILTAVFVAMTGIGRWQLLLMGLPLLAGYGLYLLAVTPSARAKPGLIRLGTAVVLAGLLMLLPALPLLQSQRQADSTHLAIIEPDNGRTDLLSYIIAPVLYNRFGDKALLVENPLYARPYDHIAASIFYVPFLGYTSLLLAIIGLVKRWRQTSLWFFLALIIILFALGPELSIHKQLYVSGRLPYALLLENNILGEFIRRPHRLNVILSIPVGILAGWGTAVLLAWPPLQQRTWAQIGVVTLIVLALITETKLAVPYTTTSPDLPAWYTQLTQDQRQYGLLELPIHDRDYSKYYMAYQTAHGKPITSGHVSRLPAEAWAALGRYPWLLAAVQQDNFPDFSYTAVGRELRRLRDDNIKYLILHKQFLDSGLLALWQDWLTVNPIYEDDRVIVYRTAPVAGEDFQSRQPLSAAIGLLQTNYAPQTVSQRGLIKVNARWVSTAVPEADYLVCLDWRSNTTELVNFPSNDAACQAISPDYDTSAWPANEVIRGAYQLPVPGHLPPGEYELLLGLVDIALESPVGETAVLGPVTVQPYPPETQLALHWQNPIQLNGYHLSQSATDLTFAPYWQITKPLTTSYKLFVHLVNPENMAIVAQSDAVPRNWTYPTNIWEPGEIVYDEINIPISDLPPGPYEIWLGWYDNVTGQPLSGEDGAERILVGQFVK